MKRKKEDIIQLVKDALSNDLSAQNNLYRIIYKHYRAQKIDEDIINEIYYRFLKNAKEDEIFNENKLWGYLNYIKKSCMIDMYRRSKNELNIEAIIENDNDVIIFKDAIEEETVLDIIISNEEKDLLYIQLERFSEANKMLYDVVIDYYIEGLNLSKIAEKYGIKYITVKDRLHKARKELQKYFQKKQK